MVIINFLLDITIFSGDNLTMKCDDFRIIKSEVFSVALISCPECGKQISDSTPSCPHCGYQLSANGAPSAPAPTKIGDISQNYAVGLSMLALGIFFLFAAVFAFIVFLPLGVLVVWIPLALIALGIQKISGTRSICCPYCGKPAEVGKNFENHKCPACKKRSVRDNDYLKPVL